jgi:hypothetical protein
MMVKHPSNNSDDSNTKHAKQILAKVSLKRTCKHNTGRSDSGKSNGDHVECTNKAFKK